MLSKNKRARSRVRAERKKRAKRMSASLQSPPNTTGVVLVKSRRMGSSAQVDETSWSSFSSVADDDGDEEERPHRSELEEVNSSLSDEQQQQRQQHEEKHQTLVAGKRHYLRPRSRGE